MSLPLLDDALSRRSNLVFPLESDSTLPCQDPATGDLWFAERTGEVEQAKQLCGGCPLRAACLEGALQRGEPWGVWGGEVLLDGVVLARKRGRGRPRKLAA